MRELVTNECYVYYVCIQYCLQRVVVLVIVFDSTFKALMMSRMDTIWAINRACAWRVCLQRSPPSRAQLLDIRGVHPFGFGVSKVRRKHQIHVQILVMLMHQCNTHFTLCRLDVTHKKHTVSVTIVATLPSQQINNHSCTH